MKRWIIKLMVTTCIILVVILLLGFSYQTTVILEIIGILVILFACATLYQQSQKDTTNASHPPSFIKEKELPQEIPTKPLLFKDIFSAKNNDIPITMEKLQEISVEITEEIKLLEIESLPEKEHTLTPIRRKIITHSETSLAVAESSKQFNNNAYQRYEILD